MSATVGGRRSEILLLHWSDIDLDDGKVTIDKALDPIDGSEKETKTGKPRAVSIGPACIAALRRWRVAFLERAMSCGIKPVADPYVFARELDGSAPWRPDLATKRFGKLPDTAGIDCRRMDLRHYVATQLLGARHSVKDASARLGHTRTSTTTDMYADAIPANDHAAAQLLEASLGG